MSLKADIREAMALWIPAGGENLDDMIRQVNAGRQAIDDFLDGKIPVPVLLEALAAENVDIDEYLEIVAENLHSIGF